jgi:hypothetical protein
VLVVSIECICLATRVMAANLTRAPDPATRLYPTLEPRRHIHSHKFRSRISSHHYGRGELQRVPRGSRLYGQPPGRSPTPTYSREAHVFQVTYRLLSRALKVNGNTAKQYVCPLSLSIYCLISVRMLYEFYTKQNAKKPKSVHATYLLTGKRRTPEHTNGVNDRDGGDTTMRSSPFMSSMPGPEEPTEEPEAEPVPKTSIVLVREEELESMDTPRYMQGKG